MVHFKDVKFPIRTIFALCLGALGISMEAAHAEGSRTLYPNGIGGNRANLEWTTGVYGGSPLSIPRRTLLKVYADAGEYILVGSSAQGVGSGDIFIFNPNSVTGNPGSEFIPSSNFRCSTQTGRGKITSRAQELNGPQNINGTNNLTGYIPCFYQAPSSGVYTVIFYGPSGNVASTGTPTGDVSLTNATTNFNATQGTTIAAWDVTVRSSTSSIADLNGRLFSYSIALFTGGNPRPLNSIFYVVTTDGYQYRVNLRGLDPNGYLFYGSQVGFFDSDGRSPLYHNVIGSTNSGQLGQLRGGVSLARPQYPVFFNTPDTTALSNVDLYDPFGALVGRGVPLIPLSPQVDSLSFTGNAGDNTSFVNTGGTFTFNSTVAGNYQLVISRPGFPPARANDPTDPENRVLRGVMLTGGTQTITWDGRDNSGNFFPVGNNYAVRIKVHAGEYHFPLIDAENSTNGGPSITLLNASNPLGNSRGFYDDRGYRTLNGTTLGLLNARLCAGGQGGNSTIIFSDPNTGFDTTSTQRAFGANSDTNANSACTGFASGAGTQTGGFGDVKGLDIWTYFPSNTNTTVLNIRPLETRLFLVKRITAINNNPTQNPNDNTALNNFIDEPGASNDDSSLPWPSDRATFLRGAFSGGRVKPTDEIEYTIYFLNTNNAAQAVTICDVVPDNQTFVPTGYNTAVPRPIESGVAASSNTGIALGLNATTLPSEPTLYLTNANDGDRGRYLPPGDPQTPAFCRKFDAAGNLIASGVAANTNGAIVVNVVEGTNQLPPATGAGTPSNSYGFIRFRARVR